jgi:hypothetical protein
VQADKTRVLTLNRQRLTDAIAAGTPSGGAVAGAASLTLEPTWCSLMDRHVFAVTVADTTLGTLLGAAHVTIARDAWAKLGKGQAPFLQGAVGKLADAALAKARAKSAARADALQIGLSLGRNVTRRDEGASACVNLLLEEKLAPAYTVARNLGDDRLATVRDALGQPAALRRPTRGLILSWTNLPETTRAGKAPNRKLPVRLDLVATVAETVFGKHVPVAPLRGAWEFRASGDQIDFAVDPALTKLLDAERATLVLADAPQVAKVYGAWVYLDRGRAWGLKMNDRVVAPGANGPDDLVKGHVVRFFGPEEGLTSPRGFPIREGAIVFVRRHQRDAKIGMTFTPDPRQYPTTYPIPKGG